MKFLSINTEPSSKLAINLRKLPPAHSRDFFLDSGKHVNRTIAFPSEHKTVLVRNRSVPVWATYLSVLEIGTKMERKGCVPVYVSPPPLFVMASD